MKKSRAGCSHSFHMKPIEKKDLEFPKTGTKVRVIDLMDHELTTGERIEEFKQVPGLAPGVDLEKDIVKVAVFERHRGTGHVGLGFLGNYGLKRGLWLPAWDMIPIIWWWLVSAMRI